VIQVPFDVFFHTMHQTRSCGLHSAGLPTFGGCCQFTGLASRTIELAALGLARWSILQRCLDAFSVRTLRHSCYRRYACLDGTCDHGIRPVGALRTGVGLQEDSGASDGASRRLDARDDLLKEEALSLGEGDALHLALWTLYVAG
jgi:hypothetical protein